MHATEFLKNPAKHNVGPIAVLFGALRFLQQGAFEAVRHLVLGGDADDEFSVVRFSGDKTDLKTVCDELALVSMWGDRRLVVVEDADDFVTRHRAGLEKYLENPAAKSVLVLWLKSFPKTTRLYKSAEKVGLLVECSELKGAQLARWITETAQEAHGKQMSRDAVSLLVELAGNDLGLLDQELSKLAAYAGDRERIVPEDVRALVGGWKAETTWTMVDALRDGNLGLALVCLDKLLTANEPPLKILGGLGFAFRKFALATEIARQGTPLNGALSQAGVFANAVQPASNYLRRIGRPRAEQLLRLLLEADADLKGQSRMSERLQLEQLLVKLGGR